MKNKMKKLSLNFFNALLGLIIATGLLSENAIAQSNSHRYKVAVVDLMILKRQKLGAFKLAKDIGADGVELDMGGLGTRETFDNKLAIDSVRNQFLTTAKDMNLEICSLGMTGFFAQSFAQRPTAIKAVQDCINTAKQMNLKVVFVLLFRIASIRQNK